LPAYFATMIANAACTSVLSVTRSRFASVTSPLDSVAGNRCVACVHSVVGGPAGNITVGSSTPASSLRKNASSPPGSRCSASQSMNARYGTGGRSSSGVFRA
jgi:hypothetical protein